MNIRGPTPAPKGRLTVLRYIILIVIFGITLVNLQVTRTSYWRGSRPSESTAINVLGIQRFVPPNRKTPTRAFLVTVPAFDSESCRRGTQDLFGFVESWRVIFGKSETSEDGFCQHSLINKIPKLRKTPSPFSLDDIIIVYPPKFCGEQILPAICQRLDLEDSSEKIMEQLNIKSRISTRDSSCFVVATDVSYLYASDRRFNEFVNELTYSVVAPTEPIVSAILEQYDVILNTRVSRILLPAVNRLENVPSSQANQFALFVQPDYYQTEFTTVMVPTYSLKLRLRHQRVTNIGTTIYGTSQDIIQIAKVAAKAWVHLIKNDRMFKMRPGECSTWCRANIPFYSIEIAVNEVVDKNRILFKPNLFASRRMPESMTQHILNPACSSIIADAPIAQGDEQAVDWSTLDQTNHIVASFAESCSRVGLWRYLYEVDKYRPPIGEFPELQEIMEQITPWFECPRSHPYPYSRDSLCCSTNVACEDSPFNEMSSCCNGDSLPCLANVCGPSPDGPIARLEPEGAEMDEDRCPFSHPFPYQNGVYCCEAPRTCGQSDLRYQSSCCLEHRNSRCKMPPCRPYWEIEPIRRLLSGAL